MGGIYSSSVDALTPDFTINKESRNDDGRSGCSRIRGRPSLSGTGSCRREEVPIMKAVTSPARNRHARRRYWCGCSP